MVEGIPNSPGNLNQLRSRAGRVEGQSNETERAERTPAEEQDDRFEPSSELAAREAGDSKVSINVNADEGGGDSEQGGESQPIQSAEEASRVVNETSDQISFNASGAAVAQGNLDQESVLNLIA